jgi:hypothetical protein
MTVVLQRSITKHTQLSILDLEIKCTVNFRTKRIRLKGSVQVE